MSRAAALSALLVLLVACQTAPNPSTPPDGGKGKGLIGYHLMCANQPDLEFCHDRN